MSPEERFEALASAPAEDLEALADAIIATGVPIDILVPPEILTLPVRLPVPGSGSTTAVIGHAAVTRCAVTVDGVRGDGMRAGRDLGGAVAAALLDAEAERGGPSRDAVAAIVRDAERTRALALGARASVVDATRLGDDA